MYRTVFLMKAFVVNKKRRKLLSVAVLESILV